MSELYGCSSWLLSWEVCEELIVELYSLSALRENPRIISEHTLYHLMCGLWGYRYLSLPWEPTHILQKHIRMYLLN